VKPRDFQAAAPVEERSFWATVTAAKADKHRSVPNAGENWHLGNATIALSVDLVPLRRPSVILRWKNRLSLTTVFQSPMLSPLLHRNSFPGLYTAPPLRSLLEEV